MHPAPSVIVFTTLSGTGFGLLAWLGIDPDPVTGLAAFAWFALAFALAVGGLISSTLHLGRPERALLAFCQWRSSWLSREGVCAVAALLIMGAYATGLIFLEQHWIILGWLGAGLCLLTVFTTSMIYAQLSTVPRWRSPLTPVLFLILSICGGAVLAGPPITALVLLIIAGVMQLAWWLTGDSAFAKRGSTTETATGLGALGDVRSFEHPHTSPNYLMKEFMFSVGRRHVQKLRVISLALMVVCPTMLLFISQGLIVVLAAATCHIIGVAISRWLFFAQAEHVVSLYYDLG